MDKMVFWHLIFNQEKNCGELFVDVFFEEGSKTLTQFQSKISADYTLWHERISYFFRYVSLSAE